jgi:hypothetical protein
MPFSRKARRKVTPNYPYFRRSRLCSVERDLGTYSWKAKTDFFSFFVHIIHIKWVGEPNLVGSENLLDG